MRQRKSGGANFTSTACAAVDRISLPILATPADILDLVIHVAAGTVSDV